MLRSLFCSFGKSLCLISVATAVCTLAPASFAQVATGTPPFGSFGGAPDVVNLANLNDHHTIPIIHKAGRGTDFTYGLSYDSSVWYPVGVSPNQFRIGAGRRKRKVRPDTLPIIRLKFKSPVPPPEDLFTRGITLISTLTRPIMTSLERGTP